jgi:phospholipase/carboxylesterase
MLSWPAMHESLLSCVEIEPAASAKAAVIWLHGLGADGHDFEPIVPHLQVDPALGVRFVFPHAPRRPVTINMGMVMPAWYDVRDLELRRDIDEVGVRESAAQIEALIQRERERGIAADRILLAGFSQGGAIALHAGLRHAHRLAGVVALSTYLVCGDSLPDEASATNREVPMFQAHGSRDPMVLPQFGEQTRDRLIELGYSVEWHAYPMGHEVHPDEIRDLGRWINRVLAADRCAGPAVP